MSATFLGVDHPSSKRTVTVAFSVMCSAFSWRVRRKPDCSWSTVPTAEPLTTSDTLTRVQLTLDDETARRGAHWPGEAVLLGKEEGPDI